MAAIFTLLLFLSGCSSEKNTNYYLLHPDKLAAIRVQCVADQAQSEKCQASYQAQVQLSQWYLLIKTNPQAFGKKILANQMHMANIQKILSTSQHQSSNAEKKKALLLQLRQLKQREQQYYVVFKMIE